MKKYTKFRPSILSRHPSHDVLRRDINRETSWLLPFRSLIRLGSTTPLSETKIKYDENRVELNSIESIKNSSNKLRMKQCFTNGNVKTALWWTYNSTLGFNELNKQEVYKNSEELPYPIVAKHIYGSRGRGNTKINNVEEMNSWMESHNNYNNFIFETFHNYNKEYRLHVTKHGCFYSCRKMLKQDTPDNNKWFRNDSNCVWILEDNPSFEKPSNWEDVVKESVKALHSIGLDFGAIDLKIQNCKNKKGEVRENPDFFIIEINSAPSFGNITEVKYKEILPKLLIEKYEKTI